MKRTGKFYFRNEKETLKSLGLVPTPGSGSGWIAKEDGENEAILVQLKSTDSDSYRVNMVDIKKLEYHAMVSHKHPLFLIQFLKQGKIYALVDILLLEEVSKGISLGNRPQEIVQVDEETTVQRKVINTSKEEREKFFREKEEGYGKRKRGKF